MRENANARKQIENNVHDVYNADVCTEVRREKRRGRRKRMEQEWGEKSGDEKEEENRRGELERRGEYG